MAAGGATSAAAELVAGYLSELGAADPCVLARLVRGNAAKPASASARSVSDAEQIAAMGRQERADAASRLMLPVSGVLLKLNRNLMDAPSTSRGVNPRRKKWMP